VTTDVPLAPDTWYIARTYITNMDTNSPPPQKKLFVC
jgi:hypothetical protein